MKAINAVLVILLFSLPGISVSHSGMVASAPGQDSEKWGQPTVERSVEGMNIRVWIVKSPVGAGSSSPPDDQGTLRRQSDSQNAGSGTHHIMVMVGNETPEKSAAQVQVDLRTTSPSGVSSASKLVKVSDGYQCDVSLKESGTYTFSMTVTSNDGKNRTVDFTYKV